MIAIYFDFLGDFYFGKTLCIINSICCKYFIIYKSKVSKFPLISGEFLSSGVYVLLD